MKQEFTRVGLVLLLCAAVFAACINRYTRAFFLPDSVPETLPYMNDRAVTNRLPEPFGPWLVEVAMVSVFQSSDYDRVQSHEYNVDIRFRLPRDSVRNLYGMRV